MKREIDIRVTFMLEIRLQKYIFLASYDHFFSCSCVPLEPKRSNCIRVTFQLEIKLQTVHLWQTMTIFFEDLCFHFEPLLE